jgi:hypothetical protein
MSNHFEEDWIRQNWINNQYYVGDKALRIEYLKYYAKGWIRPDFLPNSMLRNIEWAPVVEKWHAKLGRKISVAIYSDWVFIKNYHEDLLNRLRAQLKSTTKDGM